MVPTPQADCPTPDVVSPREREVVRLVVFGRRNAEVARALCISEATVKKHLTNVFQKLGIRRRRDLTEFAFLLGII
jgi:DNA-binding CsgD family transcriptional regulator